MQVTEKWKEKLQGTWGYLSQETDILQMKTCVDIALRCVKKERKERPDIKGIVNELEKLEAQVKKMSPASDQSRDLTSFQVQPFWYDGCSAYHLQDTLS